MDVSVCVLVVLAMVFSGARANFDCSRDTSQCMHSSTCDRATGMCTCVDAALNEGYDCSVVKADKAHTDCGASPCKNEGTCHKSASAMGFSCLCTGKWKGPTCEENRYEVICDPVGDKMSFKIQPQVPTFRGKMYYFGTTACTLTDNGGGTYERLNILFDEDPTCGSADTLGSRRTRVVLVQYSADSVFARDELVSFTCDPDGTLVVTGSGTITHVDSALVAIADSKVPVAGDVAMAMRKGGAVITAGDTINIGDQIDIEFTIVNTVDYKAMLIKDCTLSNKETANSGDADYKSGKFFEDYCEKTDLARSGFTDVTGTDTLRTFNYHASYFDGALTTVFLTCQVTLCSDACVPATCTAPITGNGMGRRKRAAGEKEQTLKTYVVVQTPSDKQSSQQQAVGDKECYQSMEMTAAVVALGVGLVIVLVICMFLTVKVILYRKSPSYNEKL